MVELVSLKRYTATGRFKLNFQEDAKGLYVQVMYQNGRIDHVSLTTLECTWHDHLLAEKQAAIYEKERRDRADYKRNLKLDFADALSKAMGHKIYDWNVNDNAEVMEFLTKMLKESMTEEITTPEEITA
jgi:hypothetical protein